MALDKESPDKDSAGSKSGGGASGRGSSTGGGNNTGSGKAGAKEERDKAPSSAGRTSSTGSASRLGEGTFGRVSNESIDRTAPAIDKEAAAPARDAQSAYTAMLQRQGMVPDIDPTTGEVTGAIPERTARIGWNGSFQPGTGLFDPANIGQFGVPEDASARARMEAIGLYEPDLPSSGRQIGSLLGLAAPGVGSMIGNVVGTTVDAARLRSGLQEAGIDPDMAEAISSRAYGPSLGVDMATSMVGGPLAREAGKLAYGAGGVDAAMAAATGANAALGAAGDYVKGSSLDAPLSADQATQIASNTPRGPNVGNRESPWFEKVASSLETPTDAVAGQPSTSSTAPAIPSRLNYLEDSMANSAMQYASNANYQPRAVYSDGASAGASGTYYGNAPASGTVRLS